MFLEEIWSKVQNNLEQAGYQSRIVSLNRLPEIHEDILNLINRGLLDTQLGERLRFFLKPEINLPGANSIIIMGIPQPLKRLEFIWNGRAYYGDIPPNFIVKDDEIKAEGLLKSVLEPEGFQLARATLPLKPLAVRSGLARYGKNNISYVPGMGSFHRLIAFYSDYSCKGDGWTDIRAMEACANCDLCVKACPAGCNSSDRFLVHAERCLTSLNVRNQEFPYWSRRQPDWPNALVGCTRCQFACPENRPYINNLIDYMSFTESETDAILNQTPWDDLSTGTQAKLEELKRVYPLGLSMNLKELIKKQSTNNLS